MVARNHANTYKTSIGKKREREREETTKGLQHRCTQLRQPRKDLSAKIFTEVTLLNQNNSLNLPLHTNITSLAIFLNLLLVSLELLSKKKLKAPQELKDL